MNNNSKKANEEKRFIKKPISVDEMTTEQLLKELSKGFNDIENGRTISADTLENEIRVLVDNAIIE